MMVFKASIWRLFQFTSLICISCVIFTYFKSSKLIEQHRFNLKYIIHYESPENNAITIPNNTWEEWLETPQFQWCPNQNKSDEELIYENATICDALFESNDKTFWEIAKRWKSPCAMNDHEIMKLTMNCLRLKNAFPFYWPKWEENSQRTFEFPIAYVLLATENAEQVVRLMQTIYRPWNLYCIAYGNDTDDDFKNSIKNLHSCYKNIILPKNTVKMNWHGISILHAIMNCMKVLHEHSIKWKYVQTLTCEDFPLKTNAEMVEIMQIFNGSQDIELAQGRPDRYRYYYLDSGRDEIRKDWRKPLPPHNIAIFKGSSMASTLSREFIHFVLRNRMAKNFYNWCETTWTPDEHYFSSLVHNLHIGAPGGFPGTCLYYYDLERSQKNFASRFQQWYCEGMITNNLCVFGVGDLHKLINRSELVAHKMRLDFETAAYYCMSKRHFTRTFTASNFDSLDRDFYKNLPAVRHQAILQRVRLEFAC